jgi:hypothetical protein
VRSALAGLVLAAAPAAAEISGFVLEEGTGTPIAGARVHVQADPSSPLVLSAADGSFTLPVSPAGMVMVSAGVEYQPSAGAGYATGGALASDGQTGVTISLLRLPATDDPSYQDFLPQVADCGNCHEEQEQEWRLSNHATAGDDAWVRDLFSGDGTPGGGAGYVFLDTHDPGETGFCATCHTPMADIFDPGNVLLNEVTSPAALEGISCIACHQMDSVNDNVQALHHLGNSTYRFPDGRPFIPTQEFVWGPLDDVVFGGMKASYAPLFAQSLLCASCHEYNRPGTVIPGQTTYSEWLASPYSIPGAGYRSCQDCHMPEADGPGYLVDPIGDPPLRPAEQIHEHELVGATQAELEEHIHLQTTVAELGSGLAVRCEVTNETGHAFPTGVSPRNALLVVEATWNGLPLQQTSGRMVPFYGSDDVPGTQDGDYARRPGAGFARLLEGRTNDQGPVVRPRLFHRRRGGGGEHPHPVHGHRPHRGRARAAGDGAGRRPGGGRGAAPVPPGVAGARGHQGMADNAPGRPDRDRGGAHRGDRHPDPGRRRSADPGGSALGDRAPDPGDRRGGGGAPSRPLVVSEL